MKVGHHDLDVVLGVLEARRFLFATERELQDGIAEALLEAGEAFAREYPLDRRSRIDFMVGPIGIEVKVAGGWRDVLRQVVRYCEFDEIAGLVVVTSKPMHSRLPVSVAGKPVHVHELRAL